MFNAPAQPPASFQSNNGWGAPASTGPSLFAAVPAPRVPASGVPVFPMAPAAGSLQASQPATAWPPKPSPANPFMVGGLFLPQTIS